MNAILETIAGGVEDIGSFFLDGAEQAINLFFAAVQLAIEAAAALLPGMPPVPKPELVVLEYVNWFYPVSAVSATVASACVLLLAYYVVRFIFRLTRQG